MARLRSIQGGSTIVEVMMAITVLAIGASGVVALQKVALTANRNARNVAIANEVARTWVERLRADAMLWNHPSANNPVPDLDDDTFWLANHVLDPNPGPDDWFRPTDSTTMCGIHDIFGRDEACGAGKNPQGPFCVNLRLSWVRADRRLIRTEVRVFWVVRNEGPAALGVDDLPCGDATVPPNVDTLAENGIVRVVHAVSAVTRNEAP